jgi:tight adherence protein B
MMDFIANLGLNTVFWSIPALLFLTCFIFAYIAMTKGNRFWGEYEEVFMETADVNMGDMFLFIDPGRLFMFNMLAIVIITLSVLLVTNNIAFAMLAFVITIIMPFQIYKGIKQRRLKSFEKLLPDALRMISGSLQAGGSLNMAMESLVAEQPAPLNQEFMLFMREQRIGVDFDTSMKHMERRLPIQDFQMFTAALRISREVGGNLAETLDALADTLRKKATMAGKIDALTGQGRMQGYVMSALPIFLGFFLYMLEPKAMSLLFTDPRGWAVLTVVVIMEVLGFFFIKKIVNIDV